jgi:polyisoprenoid-binding protein YceI
MSSTNYHIDRNHTAVGFAVRHMLVSTVRGRFKRCDADIRLDVDDFTRSSIEVHIDAASIDTGVAARDADLKSDRFFDVEHYPTLSFVSHKIERLYPAHFRVTGALTIKTTTRKVALDVEFGGMAFEKAGNTRIGFLAKGKINRRDFGLAWDELLESGGLVVGDRIQLVIDTEVLSGAVDAAAA